MVQFPVLSAQKQNSHPLPHPGFQLEPVLSPSKGWNDEDATPVIPGEQRETRNPGAPCFCLYAERLRYGRLVMTIQARRGRLLVELQ